MRRKGMRAVLSENLAYFMARDDSLYPNANKLALATNGKVSANTIRNILYPTRRTTTAKKPEGSPTLEKIETLASKLPKCEPWMLLHPDLQRALRALEMYERVAAEVGERERESART